eukprot:CAMPEP_0178761062 /NCGR_PEP_ID=MMETSP0744-20121128/15822_1 /TAXON_ID=913974 /ORGANISM="Nitzschia punctata, Strain CCMP561" /LENGTH=58 /DNA_ID=CAMNT_0020415675 /DNA_START=38 /DNA_END=214 /DNA_ORIENTATION=-
MTTMDTMLWVKVMVWLDWTFDTNTEMKKVLSERPEWGKGDTTFLLSIANHEELPSCTR